MTKKRIRSKNGGEREELGARFDWIPYRPMLWVAKIFKYGGEKYSPWNWKQLDFEGDQCPLSHAIGHALEANEAPVGSEQRIRLLAKVAWNALAQIWWEDQLLEKRRR